MYRKGEGVTQDHQESVKWYRMAAEQGDAYAQINLGFMYWKGEGVTQDHKESARWYRMAALQNHPGALNKLIVGILSGRIIPLDHDEWWRWYEREERFGSVKQWRNEAEKGERMGQFGMGLAYEKGFGVQKDIVEAYKWLKLAAAQDSENVRRRLETITRNMTPKQIQEGDQRIHDFKPIV